MLLPASLATPARPAGGGEQAGLSAERRAGGRE